MTVYWGQEAIQRLLPDAYLRSLGRESGEWFTPWVIVLAHAVVGAAATIVVLGRGKARKG